MEKLPRQLSSAQSMDEMTSQNSVMGYKAAIVAANAYGSFLPMMTTAAGTIRPAKVLDPGRGHRRPAGHRHRPKRLGAVVTAYDVRPASQAAKSNRWAPSSSTLVSTSPRARAKADTPAR